MEFGLRVEVPPTMTMNLSDEIRAIQAWCREPENSDYDEEYEIEVAIAQAAAQANSNGDPSPEQAIPTECAGCETGVDYDGAHQIMDPITGETRYHPNCASWLALPPREW